MTAPFNFKRVNAIAEAMDSQLRVAEEYSTEVWEDPELGPLLRIYALFTHSPSEAFDEPASAKQIADCRAYTYARMARLHVKRDGCECMEIDGMDDLMSELDSIADQETGKAIAAGESDANKQFAALKKKGNANPMEH